MAVNNNFINSVPSLYQPLATVFRAPIVAKRAPTANDINYSLGQVWIFPTNNAAFILTSVLAGAATWQDVSGAAGVFTSLTVNPGPTNLSTVGNGAVSIGNAGNTGAITLTVGTGNMSIVGGGHTVGIANDAAANIVTVGSTSGAASLTLQAGTGNMSLATSATGTITAGTAAMTGNINLGISTAGQAINIGNAAAANTIVIGNNTAGATTALNAPVVTLRGPVQLLTGAGAPAGGLAVNVGDFYINTTAATAATRCYMATGAGTWTNFTMAG